MCSRAMRTCTLASRHTIRSRTRTAFSARGLIQPTKQAMCGELSNVIDIHLNYYFKKNSCCFYLKINFLKMRRVTNLLLESHESCLYDSLTIFDGNSTTSNEMAKLCGSRSRQLSYMSTGGQLRVEFRADMSMNIFDGQHGHFRFVVFLTPGWTFAFPWKLHS